jgi:hypothetical protein
MRSPRTTTLLLLLVLMSGGACALALSRMDAMRHSALTAADDLARIREALPAVGPATRAGSDRADVAIVSDAADASEITRLVRDAAAKSGAEAALARIEPGRTSDASESLEAAALLVQFDPLTLRQLVTFLHTLAMSDGQFAPEAIELSAAAAAGASAESAAAIPEERWTATVTVVRRSSR